jgi:hypothetical protein
MRTHFHSRICKQHIEMVMCLRSLFWDVMQATLVVIYQCFGAIYRNQVHRQAVLTLADGTEMLPLNVAK